MLRHIMLIDGCIVCFEPRYPSGRGAALHICVCMYLQSSKIVEIYAEDLSEFSSSLKSDTKEAIDTVKPVVIEQLNRVASVTAVVAAPNDTPSPTSSTDEDGASAESREANHASVSSSFSLAQLTSSACSRARSPFVRARQSE